MAIVCRNLFREPSQLLSVGRFELVRTLGRGGMGVVYEALDPLRRERIAIKILHGRGPTHLYRLKREFRSLAELRHPNLVMLHELSVAHDDAYFTMDLIAGDDLLVYARQGAAPGVRIADEARLRRALSQLCEGVHALHVAGKLHRDLKPSNVLVQENGHVVLLDFGLVHDVREGEGAEAEGTPAYMAPEQARGEACAASDWFSFGLMLQEALWGERGLDGDPGSALDSLALRLIDPDPRQRPEFSEITASLRGGVRPASAPRRAAQAGPAFVGRADELKRLADAYAKNRERPFMLLVCGESGAGKSSLLRAFVRSLLGQGPALVLSGRCYEREAVPYKALDGIIDELSRHLLALPEQRVAVQDAAALIHVFPVLGRVPWLAGAARLADLPPVEQRARAFAALKRLFALLAAAGPLVLWIEDLQWSDADSGRLLGSVLSDEDSPPVLVLASARIDPRLGNPALEELRAVCELAPRPLGVLEFELAALTPDDSLQLASRLLGDAARARQVAAESRGNPLFLSELSRFVAESPQQGPQADLPSIDALFERRFRTLGSNSRLVLELIAAAGRPLPARVIGHAAGVDSDAYPEFKQLRTARLAHAIQRGKDELFELDHDRIAEAVLPGAGTAARVELHVRLVRALEQEPVDLSEVLSEQYSGAGMPLQAANSARHAADHALATLAFARAAQLYQSALAQGQWSMQEKAALQRDHAVALEHSGHTLEAAEAYARAAALTSDGFAAALLEQRAALRLMHNGHCQAGERVLRRGYQRLGLRWPTSRLELSLAIAYLLLPARLRRFRRSETSEALRRTRASFLAQAGGGIEDYDLLRAVHNALLCFDICEQLPDPAWHARARGARAMMRSFLLRSSDGIPELERACSEVAELGDVQAEADLQAQLAGTHYFAGQPLRALEAADRSEACLRSLPFTQIDRYPVMGIIGSALIELGRLREAQRRWSSFSHEARLHGDLKTAIWVHAHPAQFVLAIASDDRALAQTVLDRQARLHSGYPRYAVLRWSHAACSIEHALCWGTAAEALGILGREQRALFASGYRFLNEEARYVRSRALLAAAAELPRGRQRRRFLRGAAADAAALRKGRPLHQGAALLIEAGIAALHGQTARAAASFAGAGASYARADMVIFAACADYARASLDPAATLERDRALGKLRAEGIRDPLRWIRWYVVGLRSLASLPA